jgi:hypothetical protein
MTYIEDSSVREEALEVYGQNSRRMGPWEVRVDVRTFGGGWNSKEVAVIAAIQHLEESFLGLERPDADDRWVTGHLCRKIADDAKDKYQPTALADHNGGSGGPPPDKTLIDEKDKRIAELEGEVASLQRQCARAGRDYLAASGERRIIQADRGDVKGWDEGDEGPPLWLTVLIGGLVFAAVVAAFAIMDGP